MPEREDDWVDGIIPPARFWVVRYRFLGLFDNRLYLDAGSCFAANDTCRRIGHSRFPTDRDGNYRPIPDWNTQPADPADVSNRGERHLDASPNLDPDDVPAAGDGHRDDAGCRPGASPLPGDNGDTGRKQDLLLEHGSPDPGADTGVPGVRDADTCQLLPKTGVK